MLTISSQVYSTPGGIPLAFDLFHPGGEAVPLVVCLYGGGWISGDRTMYADEAAWISEQGYAAAVFDYRLAPLYPFPAAVQDAQNFVRYARENCGALKIIPDKIAAFGNSAGGHLACMLGLCSDTFGVDTETNHLVNGAISVSGLTDMRNPGESQYDISFSFIEQFLGGPYSGNEEKYASASPLAHLRDDACPFCIVHGMLDDVVPPAQSRLLHEALLAKGIESQLLELESDGHSFTYEGWDKIRETYIAFLGDVFKS